MPQPHGSNQPAVLAHGRKAQAFGGRASVAQALAGARLAIRAKAGIQQRFACDDVRATLRTDRERGGISDEGNGGVPSCSHGTSVPACNGMSYAAASVVQKTKMIGKEPARPAPGLSGLDREAGQMW
ncbi:hypothetical protein BE61_85800 [Bradyrhizobium elkanii USDA 61]|nr:hypothetical protein BE61_85800 [Bradyrhizobium elkanii USDA 61]